MSSLRPLLFPCAALVVACGSSRPPNASSSSQQAAPAPAPPPPLADGSDVPEATLRDAAEPDVGAPDMGPAEVVKSWTWHPNDGHSDYVVWVTCRGSGDSRNCGIAVGVPGSGKGRIDVRAHANAGWSPARVQLDDGRTRLRVEGDDGKGAWTQALELLQDGTVKFGKRTYPHAK